LSSFSVAQDYSGGELDSGEEISGKLIAAGGDGAEAFEFVEEASDQVCVRVERDVAVPGLAIWSFAESHR
jgi:hypothetical protein